MPTLPPNKVGKAACPRLSERLSALAESLPRGGVICDVGSDHGHLPLYLLKKRYCRRAIVTDLNPAPLERAKTNLGEAGVAEDADFYLTDGIKEILPLRPDALVIAGMGGETIAGILDRARGEIEKETFFALQPMTRVSLLRKYLYENGFRIEKEELVAENEKIFVLLFARYDGVCRYGDEDFYFFGEFLPQATQRVAQSYFEARKAQLEARAMGKKKAGLDAFECERRIRRCQMILEKLYENL